MQVQVIIWDTARLCNVGNHLLHHAAVAAIGISPNDRYVASAGGIDDPTILIWDIDAKSPICGECQQFSSIKRKHRQSQWFSKYLQNSVHDWKILRFTLFSWGVKLLNSLFLLSKKSCFCVLYASKCFDGCTLTYRVIHLNLFSKPWPHSTTLKRKLVPSHETFHVERESLQKNDLFEWPCEVFSKCSYYLWKHPKLLELKDFLSNIFRNKLQAVSCHNCHATFLPFCTILLK